jgi:hypothetical protein
VAITLLAIPGIGRNSVRALEVLDLANELHHSTIRDNGVHLIQDLVESIDYFISFICQVCACPAVPALLQELYTKPGLVIAYLAPCRPILHLEALGSFFEGTCLADQHKELVYPDPENRLASGFDPNFISDVHRSIDTMKPPVFQGERAVDIS